MIEAKSGFGFDEAGELKILADSKPAAQSPHLHVDFPHSWERYGCLPIRPREYLDWMWSRMPSASSSGRRLAAFADIRCEPRYVLGGAIRAATWT